MTEGPDDGLDFAELVQLVAREIRQGIWAASQHTVDGARLHVADVRVRFGRAEPTDEDESGPARGLVLLADRYAPAAQSWEIEIALSAGSGPATVRTGDGEWTPVPGHDTPTLMAVFGDLPVAALKGAGASWAKRFEAVGIATIADLASVAAADLDKLVKTSGSRKPIELHYKSRLLRTTVPPLVASVADDVPLFELAGDSANALRLRIGPRRFSNSAAERLSTILSLLFTVIDGRVLRGFSLADLRLAATSGSVPPT